jgi:hypothetical protein
MDHILHTDFLKQFRSKRKLRLSYLEDNSHIDEPLLNNFIEMVMMVCPCKSKAMLVLGNSWYLWHDANFNMICFQKTEHYRLFDNIEKDNKSLDIDKHSMKPFPIHKLPTEFENVYAFRKSINRGARTIYYENLKQTRDGLPSEIIYHFQDIDRDLNVAIFKDKSDVFFGRQSILHFFLQFVSRRGGNYNFSSGPIDPLHPEQRIIYTMYMDGHFIKIIKKTSSEDVLSTVYYQLDQEVSVSTGYNIELPAKIIGIITSRRNGTDNTFRSTRIPFHELNNHLFKLNGQYFMLIQKLLMHWLNAMGLRIVEKRIAVIHPLYIEVFPYLSLKIFNSYILETPQLGYKRINFMDNVGNMSMGNDEGGLTAQAMSIIAKTLFTPLSSRSSFIIHKNQNYQIPIDMDTYGNPIFSKHASEDQKVECSKNILILFQRAIHRRISIGRVIPDHVFEFLRYPHDLSSQQVAVQYASQMKNDEIHIRWANINKSIIKAQRLEESTPTFLTNNKSDKHLSAIKETWIDLLAIGYDLPQHIIDFDMQNITFEQFRADVIPSEIYKLLYDFTLENINEIYMPYVQFIHTLHKELNGTSSRRYQLFKNRLEQQNTLLLSHLIQGFPFDRNQIAQCIRIVSDITTEVLEQKMQFLIDHIKDANTPEEWVKRFVYAVTGSNTITANTTIKINGVSHFNKLCVAHTCFQTIDVGCDTHECESDPRGEYDPRSRFIRNLTIGIMEAGDTFELA